MLKCTGKFVTVRVRKAERGTKSIAPLILNLATKLRWVVSYTLRALYLWEKAPVPIIQEVGWLQNRLGSLGEEKKCVPLSGFEP